MTLPAWIGVKAKPESLLLHPGTQGNEEWARAEVRRAFDKASTITNPRKTEQNRRAQARFRQRKKVGPASSKHPIP